MAELTEQQKKFLDVIQNESHKIGHLVGFKKLTPLHHSWIYKMLKNQTIYVLKAHRGSYKSTSMALFFALSIVLRPDKTIIFVRKTDDDVKEIVEKVKKILVSPIMVHLAYIFHGINLELTKSTAFEVSTNLKKDLGGGSQLSAMGLKGSLTGKHADIVVVDDICFVAGTKIATPFGDRNIEDLKIGDLVLTPFGYRKIIKTTHREANVVEKCGLIGTPEHPIYNKNENKFDFLINSDYNNCSIVNIKDLIKWKIAEILSNGMVENGNEQVENIISCGQIINTGLVKCCIEQYGKNILAKFPKVMLFIIKTIIQTIITLITWNVYLIGNIVKDTCLNHKGSKCLKRICEKSHDQPCTDGKNQKKDKKDLKRWGIICNKKVWKNLLKQLALNVERYLKCTPKQEQECAELVEKEKLQDDTILEKKLKKIVYNIEVENAHVYYANGILVHNCNTKDRESKKERDITKNVWYELNSNIKNPNGSIIAIGTTWHPDDVFSVMPPAEVHTCYETGLLTDEQIQVIKENMPPALFSANYELRFVASEDCLFFTPEYVEDETLIENGLCHVDAGYGGGDYTAFSVLKKISDKEEYIAYGKMWRRHVNDCIPEIESLIKKYKLGTLYMENNGDKGYLQREFKFRGVRCMAYHERMNKYTKITTYLYKMWKNIKWLKSTDEQYMAQILDYTENAEHDDALEIANLCRLYTSNKAKCIKGLKI